MLTTLRLQVDKLKENIQLLDNAAGDDPRDMVIAELREQLRATQDELHSVVDHPFDSYQTTMPWTSQDEIDEDEEVRKIDDTYERYVRSVW